MYMPEPQPAASGPGGAPIIGIRALGKQFGTRVVVSDFALEVQPGEAVAIAGANGSGKSTLLRLLAGLLRPDAGIGTVLGDRLGELSAMTRNAIGYLPQRCALHQRLAIIESLRFRAAVAGMSRPAQRARETLDALGLRDRAREPLEHFSGGWQRHIEIAATLIHRPRLIILDEPTTGLDVAACARIWVQLRGRLAAGAALVFTSHSDAERAGVDRSIVMRSPGDV
jgi:ABC-type multidrug transport system ATPase subunit